MRYLSFFIAVAMVHVLTGVVTTGSPWRRRAGVALATGALVLPYLMPGHSGIRFVFALGAAMGVFRAIDLRYDTKPRTTFWRIQHVLTPFDTRRITFTRRHHLSGRAALSLLGYGALTAVTIWALLVVAPRASGVAFRIVRLGIGLVFAYALTDFTYNGIRSSLQLAGFEVYEFHLSPIASRTIKEFWGERWNRTISAWFFEHILRPLARRKLTRLGVVGSFGASAVLHAYLVLCSLGVGWAAVMFGYFALQAVFVMIELRLRANQWSRAAGHAWTVTLMALSSPLFVEPALRAIGF